MSYVSVMVYLDCSECVMYCFNFVVQFVQVYGVKFVGIYVSFVLSFSWFYMMENVVCYLEEDWIWCDSVWDVVYVCFCQVIEKFVVEMEWCVVEGDLVVLVLCEVWEIDFLVVG